MTDRAGRRVIATAIALSAVGVVAPVAFAAMAATGLQPWPPLAAIALVVLLVLAPGGVCLATALAGMRLVASLVVQSREAELAVLRVLVAALLFGFALAIEAALPHRGFAADGLLVAASALIIAWVLLLCVIRWPVAAPLRRDGTMLLDIAVFSAFLHFGGGGVAGWYPFYLLMISYNGLRFGLRALLDSALAAILGFAAVVLSTEIWRIEPALSIGLLLALAVIPACFAGTVHALGTARVKAARAEAARQFTLKLIADTLRNPSATAQASQAACSPINDIVDFAALEAGTFVPPIETFELRALIKRILLPAQVSAAGKGLVLHWRVDARLPYRLRGQAQALMRILSGLADHATEAAGARAVCVTAEPGAIDAGQLRLMLRVDGLGPYRDPGLAADEVPLSLRLVQRLVALVGGTFAVGGVAGQRIRLTVTVPLAIEEGTPWPVPDLAGRSVLIATEDDELARELTEPLAAWNADPRRPDDIAAALTDLSRLWQTRRRIVIVDGRDKLLSALSLAHHAARLGSDAPFVILIADEGQIASLGEVDQGELDGFIPTPVSRALLANALDALPLESDPPARARVDDPPRPVAQRQTPSAAPVEQFSERITPIASHPKFVPETAAALDMRAIDGLRELGGDPAFLGELVETFQADSQQIMERLDRAVAAADATGFARGLTALRRAASPLGGTQLCELLASLQGLTSSELRQLGAIHVQRLDAEVERLAAALAEIVTATKARVP